MALTAKSNIIASSTEHSKLTRSSSWPRRSFNALWPVLDEIKAQGIHPPCGFSALYDGFCGIFRALPDVLKKFDHFDFNAEKYRDIDFVRS